MLLITTTTVRIIEGEKPGTEHQAREIIGELLDDFRPLLKPEDDVRTWRVEHFPIVLSGHSFSGVKREPTLTC